MALDALRMGATGLLLWVIVEACTLIAWARGWVAGVEDSDGQL